MLTAITLAVATLALAQKVYAAQPRDGIVNYGFITRPHNGYWQIACFARDFGKEFLTMPWQGRFATRVAAERYARANVDCDY